VLLQAGGSAGSVKVGVAAVAPGFAAEEIAAVLGAQEVAGGLIEAEVSRVGQGSRAGRGVKLAAGSPRLGRGVAPGWRAWSNSR
jgi:hypothetical protein